MVHSQDSWGLPGGLCFTGQNGSPQGKRGPLAMDYEL